TPRTRSAKRPLLLPPRARTAQRPPARRTPSRTTGDSASPQYVPPRRGYNPPMSAAASPSLLEYATPLARDPWRPILFKPSRRSILLALLTATAITWPAPRH